MLHEVLAEERFDGGASAVTLAARNGTDSIGSDPAHAGTRRRHVTASGRRTSTDLSGVDQRPTLGVGSPWLIQLG